MQLLSRNPMTGVETSPIFDADGKLEKIVEVQSGAYVAAAKDWAQHTQENAHPLIGHTQNHRRQIAEIPTAVVNELMRQGIWGDTPALLKWLQHEGTIFRSSPGKLI